MILNEREASKARATVQRAKEALSPAASLEATRTGLSIDVLERHRRAVSALGGELSRALDAYENARNGNFQDQVDAWRGEPGIVLILARIAMGMSQAELAARLGMREQQIQRYEADRYKSISLSNYRRVASLLSVRLEASIDPSRSEWLSAPRSIVEEYPKEEIRKVVAHATSHGWFGSRGAFPEQAKALSDFLAAGTVRGGSAALLRTGIKNADLSHDLSLAAWRTQVFHRAEAVMDTVPAFDPLDIGWLGELVRLSERAGGPQQAVEFLATKGVVVVVELQISGLRLDGAAMMLDGTPIIGLTLRHDRIDNFWFTLLHELAHIFLHHRAGLSAGFFDDFEADDIDEIEDEANEFASSALIPPERWRLSPARIASAPEPIEQLARQLGIHPAIVFGRIRQERNDYSIFSKRVGFGEVKKLFVP